MRILKHAIAVMRPRGGVFDLEVDDEVLSSIVGFLEYLPAPTRLSFPLGLRLLEYGPFLFREGFRTFSSMDDATAARYLHHWERAGSAPSLLYQGVRALVFVCFYQHPKVLAAMEVDWQGRADERVRFRARVLREQVLRQAAAKAPSKAPSKAARSTTKDAVAAAAPAAEVAGEAAGPVEAGVAADAGMAEAPGSAREPASGSPTTASTDSAPAAATGSAAAPGSVASEASE